MQKAYLSYGFNEGDLLARKMISALREKGYEMTSSPTEADLIITHSGGHLLLENIKETTRILAIDPAVPSGRSPVYNFFAHLAYDIRYVLFGGQAKFYCQKTLLNLCYAVINMRHNLRIARAYRQNKNINLLLRDSTVITKSADPSWQHHNVFAHKQTYTFNASHDDCWLHPERYLNLL